jgi:acetylornithine deacetylase/succinyl-diaminopimelate desuccinylase-like protein
MVRRLAVLALLFCAVHPVTARGQALPQPMWAAVDAETLRHFQALLRLDTTSPPGNETRAVEYLKQVLDTEGIPVQVFALDPSRANLVARLKGSGAKRPLLLMGHTDTVNIDAAKWTRPPFSAVREGGYIYGRGTVDDKDNLVANLMTLILLKRMNVALDRDVIFLAESGEEGGSTVGIKHMISDAVFPAIAAEYCLAEGGGVRRAGGQVQYASVQTLQKHARTIELTAQGPSGHASVPLLSNAVIALSEAVAAVGRWQAPIQLNETSASYFRRLATVSSPADAARYRAVLDPQSPAAAAALEYFLQNEPTHASMLHTSLTPTITDGGYRVNVIPSDAKATFDVRMVPDEDDERLLAAVRKVVNNPSVRVEYGARVERPRSTVASRLDSEAFKTIEAAVTRVYNTITIPTMATGGTDMAEVRSKGVQCFGIGPAVDIEDGPLGFGSHSDQERILERELYRFVRLTYEVALDLARRK